MRTRPIGLTIGLPTVVMFVAAAYADGAAVHKELESLYAKLGSAIQKKDLRGYMNLLTSDFTRKRRDGKTTTRQQEEANWKQAWAWKQHDFAAMKSSDRASITIDKLVVTGNKAVATVKTSVVVSIVPSDEKEHKFTIDSRARDTWTRTAKGWRIQSAEDLPDGKSVGPAAPAAKRKQ